MKKILNKFLICILLAFTLPAMAGNINPNQIQGYPNIFTGKNVISANADMSVSQVNGQTLTTVANNGTAAAGTGYAIDNVQFQGSQASKIQTVQVNSVNVGTYTEGYLGSLGATNALRTSVLAQYTTNLATDYFYHQIPIEGFNFARFEYGTANAKAGSLQFKVRCSVSGTYAGAIQNYAGTRSYPFSYACTSATDTQIYVQNIPGDTGGTWTGATNQGAAKITFDLGSGANFRSTAGTWQTGDYVGVTGAASLVAQANGATLDITDVQFEVGTFSTNFERKLYDQQCRFGVQSCSFFV